MSRTIHWRTVVNLYLFPVSALVPGKKFFLFVCVFCPFRLPLLERKVPSSSGNVCFLEGTTNCQKSVFTLPKTKISLVNCVITSFRFHSREQRRVASFSSKFNGSVYEEVAPRSPQSWLPRSESPLLVLLLPRPSTKRKWNTKSWVWRQLMTVPEVKEPTVKGRTSTFSPEYPLNRLPSLLESLMVCLPTNKNKTKK